MSWRLSIAALSLFAFSNVWAQTPAGMWENINEKTGKKQALIEIKEQNGELTATIRKVYNSPHGDNPICEACPGDKKGKPVIGMQFVWGLKPASKDLWEGGSILDPESGKVYSSKLELRPGGNEIKVRGYVGSPMFGRTQNWVRAK